MPPGTQPAQRQIHIVDDHQHVVEQPVVGELADQVTRGGSESTTIKALLTAAELKWVSGTEFVRVGLQHALLRRIVQAAEIDTVIDTRLVVDSLQASPRVAHDANVIGTMNILAACGGPDSPVRKVIFKSSGHYYGCEQDDPAFFDETMVRPHPPRTPVERDIVEAEASVNEFAEKNAGCAVTMLRFANVLGPSVRTAHIDLFSLPAVPMILGFDPRYQFVHEDDVVHALEHAARQSLPGVFNVAGDGVLALTEVASLLGKPYAPILPPWGTGLAAAALRRVGVRIPPEALAQLRFGRGVDNRRFKAGGFRYQHTTREAVLKLGEHLRLHPVVRGAREPYRYEREVEEFLRWSPHVRNAREKVPRGAGANGGEPDRVAAAERRAAEAEQAAKRALELAERASEAAGRAAAAGREPGERGSSGPAHPAPVEHYDDLGAEEVIGLLGSLERTDLHTLREYELQNANRARVLSAIDARISHGETPV